MNVKAAQYILTRANELGITLWIVDDKVKYRGAAGTIPPKMFEVVRVHKADLIAYLPYICSVCQQEVEHYSSEGIPYCQLHYDQLQMSQPRDLAREEIIDRFVSVFGECAVTIDAPGYTLVDRARELENEARAQRRIANKSTWRGDKRDMAKYTDESWYAIPYGAIWQSIVDGSQTEDTRDYWARTRAKLQAQGYYEQVARDEEAFRNRVDVPRVYPAPVPRFELIETDGIKKVVQVGYWPVTGKLEVTA